MITAEMKPRFNLIPVSDEQVRPDRAMRIVREVADEYGLSVTSLRGGSRKREFAWARQIAMVRLIDETTLSYPAIARVLGCKDHTTIIYGERVARQRLKEGLL